MIKTLSKYLSVTLASILMLTFCACGNDEVGEDTVTKSLLIGKWKTGADHFTTIIELKANGTGTYVENYNDGYVSETGKGVFMYTYDEGTGILVAKIISGDDAGGYINVLIEFINKNTIKTYDLNSNGNELIFVRVK